MSSFWQETIENAIRIRHELHSHPELGWQEEKTAERVRNELTRMDIPWEPCAQTGTIARLSAHASGKHIALRGDIDALPIEEKSGKSYSSHNDGCMHACGHDGHTATLLAAARWLKTHEATLAGPVTLLFQPAEEGGHGALRMIEGGALKGVDEIYGWHNWPAVPFGQMVCPDGIVMCGNGTFSIRLIGKGGHASQPDLCDDPVLAASAITLALQQVVSRKLAPQNAAVLSVTSIDAPSAPTVIPETATLSGSIRVPDQVTRDTINALIKQVAEHTAISYGVRCEVDIQPRYHATINHAVQATTMRRLWQEQWGSNSLAADVATPIMASEDFSYYLREIPGAFALIGADDGPEHQSPCHSAYYDFNDRLIPKVTQLFAALVGAPIPSSL